MESETFELIKAENRKMFARDSGMGETGRCCSKSIHIQSCRINHSGDLMNSNVTMVV